MQKVNFQDKPLSEFTTDDTLYMKKTQNGYSFYLLLKFIKFEKGIIHGEVISTEHSWLRGFEGKVMTTKPNKCYTYSELSAHFLTKVGKEYKCIKKEY